MNEPTETPPELAPWIDFLVAEHCALQDWKPTGDVTSDRISNLLCAYRQRVADLDDLNNSLERHTRIFEQANLTLRRNQETTAEAFKAMSDACGTANKLLELVEGIRDPHREREAELTLIIRFLNDALQPVRPDDLSDIPF